MQDSTQKDMIDDAIAACDAQVNDHGRRAGRILSVLLLASAALIGVVALFGSLLFQPLTRLSEEKAVSALFSSPFIFAVLAIFTIMFGVLMSIYRFHLVEVAKAEYNKLGFMRIRIAASGSDPGFQSEVRLALTDNAFSVGQVQNPKGKAAESPFPGHPTSDVTAAVLNKIMERFEFIDKKATKQ